MTKSLMIVAVMCVLSVSVTCRLHAPTRDFNIDRTRESKTADIDEDYYENVVQDEKTNIFKYILDAYYKMADENNRLKEKYSQLSAFVKFLTEGILN